jgi:hypothetical protein
MSWQNNKLLTEDPQFGPLVFPFTFHPKIATMYLYT